MIYVLDMYNNCTSKVYIPRVLYTLNIYSGTHGLCMLHTVNIYRYKAIGANAISSVILYTGKCISYR